MFHESRKYFRRCLALFVRSETAASQAPAIPATNQTSAADQQSPEAEDARRCERLAPFAEQIHFMLRALRRSLLPTRTIEGLIVVAKSHVLERYLGDFALEYSRLPTGKVQLRYGGDQFLRDAHWFDVDLDALATMVARDCAPLALPNSYRLPRRQRRLFFKQRIAALISAFDDCFLIEPGPQRENAFPQCKEPFWLRQFLQDYVEDYERLPRGRMRAASSQIPVSTSWYDFGEVDFDALRQAAGLSHDSDEHTHSAGAPSS